MATPSTVAHAVAAPSARQIVVVFIRIPSVT